MKRSAEEAAGAAETETERDVSRARRTPDGSAALARALVNKLAGARAVRRDDVWPPPRGLRTHAVTTLVMFTETQW